ncbi:MAG: trigger factor [Streptosporangiales bacterium]|nr:trigger factor [Streptosporangiales bacterium]
MKTEVERLNPTRVKLTVEVSFEELKPSLDKAYRDVAKQVNIPGFRRGKVPPAIIDQRLGRGVVLEQAIQDAVPRAYGEALREENVRPLGQPELDIKEFAEDAPLSFTAEVDTRPEFELPDYAGVEIQVESGAVGDEEVDQQLDGLRERFAVLRGADRAVAEGDYVSIDLKAEVDGEELEDVSVNGMSYEVGRGGLVEGLDDALAGMSAEESKTFNTTLLGERAGEQADVTVSVQQVKEKQLPDLDDEFAQTASEYDTLAELRDDLRSRLERSRTSQQANEAQEKALDALLDLVDFPVPDSVVEEEVNSRKDNLEQQLGNSGLDLEQYLASQDRGYDEYLEELRENALKSVRAGWLLDDIADSEEVTVEEQDLSLQITQMAARMGVEPQVFADHLLQSGQINQLWGEVRRGKALEAVVAKATVTDDAGNTVDLAPEAPAEDAADGADEDAAAEDADK